MIELQNYNQAGFTSANSVKFVRTDDTPQQRKDVTFSRKAAVMQKDRSFSVPEYRVVFRKDAQEGGIPTGQRTTVDLTIRTPLEMTTGDFDEALAEIKALVSDESFKDAVMRQLFPVSA